MNERLVLEIDKQPYSKPEPAKVSEMLREFAEPLLYADPAGPPDVDTVRTAMMLAMICWNLPVYEALGHPLFAQGTKTLDAVSKNVPSAVASILRRLIHDRKTKYAAAPFLVLVEVSGDTLDDALIKAEARMPGPRH